MRSQLLYFSLTPACSDLPFPIEAGTGMQQGVPGPAAESDAPPDRMAGHAG